MSRKRFLWIALLAGALALVLSACGQKATPAPGAPAPGAAKKAIKIYELPDITGPVAIVALPLFDGALGWAQWINERGGINGHPVEMVYEDTGYEVPRVLAIGAKHRAQGAPLHVIYSSGGGEALKPACERSKVVCFNFGQSDPQYYPPAYNLTWGLAYGDGMGAWLDWVKANWKETRKPKIAVFTYDNPFGRAVMEPGERYAKYLGFDWYGTEFAGWVPADTTPQLVKFRDAGVDFFFSQFLPQTGAVVQRDITKLGLKGKLIPAYFWWNPPDQVLEVSGPDAEFAMFTNLHYLPQEADKYPEIAKARDFAAKTGKKFTTPYIRGWRNHQLLAEAYKRALAQVGDDPDRITGEMLHAALMSIKDFDSGLGPKEGIKGANYRVFQDVARIEQIKGGKIEVLTGFQKAPHLFPPDQASLFPGSPLYK